MFGDIFFLSWLSVVLGVFFNVVDTVKLTGLCCSTNCHVFHKFTEVVTHTSPGVFVVFLQKNLNLQLDRKKTQTAVSSVQLSEEELVLSEPRGCPA